jgi:5-methylcytosine-specific restriction endonuclease McrA
MTKKEIRPAADRVEHQSQAATGSWAWTFCRRCNGLKPLEQMRADRRFKTGRRPTCEECDPVADQELKRAKQWLYRYWGMTYRYGIWPVWELVTASGLIDRYGDQCFYCSGDFEVIDHRVPVAAGGHHVIDNLVPCCADCNRKKIGADRAAIRQFREARSARVSDIRRL